MFRHFGFYVAFLFVRMPLDGLKFNSMLEIQFNFQEEDVVDVDNSTPFVDTINTSSAGKHNSDGKFSVSWCSPSGYIYMHVLVSTICF